MKFCETLTEKITAWYMEFYGSCAYELANLHNFSGVVGGRLGVIRTFRFFGKSKERWNFLFPFLKIVHQKGSLRSNKINYEVLQLSVDSRYLQSGYLNKA